MTKKVCREISDIICKELDDIDGYVFAYTELMLPEMRLDCSDIRAEDFINTYPKNQLTIRLFVTSESETKDSIRGKIDGALKEQGQAKGIVHVYFVDEKLLGKVEESTEDNVKAYGDFEDMVREKEEMTFSFENGQIIGK